MNKNNHHEHPELWFRSSPILPTDVLCELFDSQKITATPRLGKRDGAHEKGYIPGQIATLRVLDDNWKEYFSCQIRIMGVKIKPLEQLVPEDLKGSILYRDWKAVQSDLSYFEKRAIEDKETVSVIEFSYI
ncbi:MAG: hypothetical protein V1711_02855 [bacterium]